MPVYEGKQALNVLQRASYAMSVHDLQHLPPPTSPEIAFAGRSNSGKSSAINALARRTRLAHVSRTPGRTQAINFFSLGGRGFLVDLPGYGYAAVPLEQKARWNKLISAYIASRAVLHGLMLVMDARHPFGPLDTQLLEWIAPRRLACHVLLAKADKLSRPARSAALRQAERAAQALAGGECRVQLFSSKTGEGIDAARATVAQWLDNKKPPVKGE